MHDRISHLLNLCMQAKAKGHDCFCHYQPHINRIEISIYLHGWREAATEDKSFWLCAGDGYCIGCDSVDTVEAYLKELVK